MEDQPKKRAAPRKDDVLFSAAFPDWQNNACLNVVHGGDYYGYKEGYRLAAKTLVQQIIDTQRDQDLFVYVIIYLYRHHAELVLKSIIGRIPYLTDQALTKAQERHMKGHSLDELWGILKERLSDLSDKDSLEPLPAEDLEGIDSYIRQMTEVDPRAVTFRFVRERSGSVTMPTHLRNINLRHFSETWEKLADYLDLLDTWTAHMEDCQHQMESDWR